MVKDDKKEIARLKAEINSLEEEIETLKTLADDYTRISNLNRELTIKINKFEDLISYIKRGIIPPNNAYAIHCAKLLLFTESIVDLGGGSGHTYVSSLFKDFLGTL